MSHGFLIDWAWNHTPYLRHLIATYGVLVFTGSYTILTWQLLRFQKRPLVTLIALVKDISNAGEAKCVVANVGPCAALTVVLFQEGHEGIFKPLVGFRVIGDMEIGSRRSPEPALRVRLIDIPFYLYYRDSALRWYATKIVRQGYGISTLPLRRRFGWQVPAEIRDHARAEAIGERFMKRLRLRALRHPIQSWKLRHEQRRRT